MSVFTVVIIIWVLYQLGISLMKKGKQQTPRNSSDKLPDSRSLREVLQGTPRGSWREQMQEALQNSSRQLEEWTAQSEPLKSVRANDVEDGYVQAEVTQGIEGTSAYEEKPVIGIYHSTEESPGKGMPNGAQTMEDVGFSITKKELVQGVVWAEILGKPRALQPFRGPRS